MADLNHLGLTRAEFTDRGLQLVRPTLGPTVMILGITDNTAAPLEDPYRVERGASLADFDLTTGLPSEITKAVQECQAGGAENIEVFVISTDGATRHGTISNANRYTALGRAYTLLRNHAMDIVVPVGAYVDSTGLSAGTSFAHQLANFCYRGTREFTARFGVLGATPPTATTAPTGIPTLAEMSSWVSALASYSTAACQGAAFPEYDGTTDAGGDNIPDTYALLATTDEAMPTGAPPWNAALVQKDANGLPIDIGAYIACYAGWERFRNTAARRLYPTTSYYHANGAAAFAGLIAATKSHEAPRNIPLPGAEKIRALSPAQADSLAGKRLIVSCTKLGQYMVYDAPTAAHNLSAYVRSDFVRITTVRVMHDAVDQVRAAANPFIRLSNSVTNREALKAALDEGLSILKEKGLEKWDFNLVYTTAMKVLGQLEIELDLWIQDEIQHITVRVGLRK